MNIKQCPMCGRYAHTFKGMWYKYDNGQAFLEYVCAGCIDTHAQLLRVGA